MSPVNPKNQMSDWQTLRPASEIWAQYWKPIHQAGQAQQLFVLLDLAQAHSLKDLLPADEAQPLFGFARGSKEAQASPWLVRLGQAGKTFGRPQQKLLDHVLAIVQTQPCGTLLMSDCGMDVLLAHLRRAMDVKMQGQDPMYLAFWDPAILAALMGQKNLDTDSQVDAVLQPAQMQALLGPVSRWVCWSRTGKLVAYSKAEQADGAQLPALPISLSRRQVDAMVNATVPDLVMYYLKLNQSSLWGKLPPLTMYWFVRQQIAFARRIGLSGTRDLVNYLCLALIAGERMDQIPTVQPILARVKAGRLPFDKAMQELAEVLDDKDLKPPKLLLDAQGRPLKESDLPR